MNSAFDGSNAIRIILQTDVDFSSTLPSTVEILYTEPDETEGTWTASILSGSETTGKIYYDLTTSDSLTEGRWKVRAKLTYSDGRVLYTEEKYFDVGN